MNPNLLLGEPRIDHQHAELFHSFQRMIASGDSAEGLSEVLSTLSEQIYKHFQSEELFMLRLDLPPAMFSEHQAAHGQIIEDLTQLHIDAMHGFGMSIEKTIAMVSGCINQHLVEFDLGLKLHLGK